MASALRLLKARARSRHEMEAALERRGFPAEVRSPVIEKLFHWGYLNDATFATRRAAALFADGHGPDGILRKLELHGIDAAAARAALDKASAEAAFDPLEAARALLTKRRLLPAKDRRTKARAARLLASRGFSESTLESLLGDPSLDPAGEDE